MLRNTIFSLCLLSLTVLGSDVEEYRARLLKMALQIEADPKLTAAYSEFPEARIIPIEYPTFNCTITPKSPTKPTSVHQLRPGDIDVVAAYGDSITAGNGLGAKHALELVWENRGESWCIGGDKTLEEGVLTLPNILRKWNPDLYGWSRCSATEDDPKYSGLNLARPGARADDTPTQSWQIIERMTNDPNVNINEDWKMITYFIGGNDLCAVCDKDWDYNNNAHPARWGDFVEEAVSIIYHALPRVYMNIVPMFDASPLPEYTRNILCDVLHWGFCDCVMNETWHPYSKEIQMAYYDELHSIVESGKYNNDNFTLVMQPYLRDQLPARDPETGDWDYSFLSKDCFHPSRKMHQSMALGLWNNMLQPYGRKDFAMDPSDMNPIYFCPTDQNPYIYTKVNSPPDYPTTAKRTTNIALPTTTTPAPTPTPTPTTSPPPTPTPPPTTSPAPTPTPPPTTSPTPDPTTA